MKIKNADKMNIDPTFPRLFNPDEAGEWMSKHDIRPGEYWTGDKIRYWVDQGAIVPVRFPKGRFFLTDKQMHRLARHLGTHPSDEPRHFAIKGITVVPDEQALRAVSFEDAMQILGVGRSTLKTMIRANEIAVVKKGKPMVFDRLEVEDVLRVRNEKTAKN